MSFRRGFLVLFSAWLVVGCGQQPTGGADPSPAVSPAGMGVAQPMAAAPARPASAARGGCVDAVLIRAFGDLTSCNFKDGVIDYQCVAWKRLEKLTVKRERENKALVQLSLVQLLDHSDERVRLVAAKSLSGYALQHSVSQRLIAAYASEKRAVVRAWIVHSLHSPRPEATKVVVRALVADADAIVRARAAQRLNITHYARNPAVAKALINAIQTDKSKTVRKRAAESLGALRRDKTAEKLLIDCLKDADIGPHCAIGLGRMRSEKGYAAVWAILNEGLKKRVIHPLYVWTIMDFMARPFFKATAVRILLQRIVRNPKMPSGARHYAVKSLGRLGKTMAKQKAAVVQFLRGLTGDKKLMKQLRVSVNPTLKQLQRPVPLRRGVR